MLLLNMHNADQSQTNHKYNYTKEPPKIQRPFFSSKLGISQVLDVSHFVYQIKNEEHIYIYIYIQQSKKAEVTVYQKFYQDPPSLQHFSIPCALKPVIELIVVYLSSAWDTFQHLQLMKHPTENEIYTNR